MWSVDIDARAGGISPSVERRCYSIPSPSFAKTRAGRGRGLLGGGSRGAMRGRWRGFVGGLDGRRARESRRGLFAVLGVRGGGVRDGRRGRFVEIGELCRGLVGLDVS